MSGKAAVAEKSVAMQVIEGIEVTGDVNVEDAQILKNIKHSIRLGYPQLRMQAVQADRVCIVGSGPSLASTEKELVELSFTAGVKIVTVNGAYKWCLERNIRPAAQIVLDARESNARFVDPPIPQCRYMLASQCHPATWKAVEGRPDVWIWHSMGEANAHRTVLDEYYVGKRWQPIVGGITVVTRAIALLRTIGFIRMDLFGVDSCWLPVWVLQRGRQFMKHGGTGKTLEYPTRAAAEQVAAYAANDYGEAGWTPMEVLAHHAFAQPENDVDKAFPFKVEPTGYPERSKTFICSPWHIQQLEDFLQMVRINGDNFLLNVHGNGLLAYALQANADITLAQE